MAPPKRPWFRFYVDSLYDMRVRRLTPAQRWVWLAVQALCTEDETFGQVHTTEDEVALIAGVSVGTVRRTMAKLVIFGLVEVKPDHWWLPFWPEEQYLNDQGRDHIPLWMRRVVMERDGGRCRQCASTDRPELDHIIPFSKGGPTTVENLQVLCKPCNQRKAARLEGVSP